jgi:hypothetical protein
MRFHVRGCLHASEGLCPDACTFFQCEKISERFQSSHFLAHFDEDVSVVVALVVIIEIGFVVGEYDARGKGRRGQDRLTTLKSALERRHIRKPTQMRSLRGFPPSSRPGLIRMASRSGQPITVSFGSLRRLMQPHRAGKDGAMRSTPVSMTDQRVKMKEKHQSQRIKIPQIHHSNMI